MTNQNCIDILKFLQDGQPRTSEEVADRLKLPKDQTVPQIWVALGQLGLVRKTENRYFVTKLGKAYLAIYDLQS